MHQSKNAFPVSSLLLILTVCSCNARTNAEERTIPEISVRFVNAATFVGEPPRVIVELTAPKNQPLELLKQDVLITYESVVLKLYDPEGRLVIGGPPHITPAAPRDWPDNIFRLPAGETCVWQYWVSRVPQSPGKYILQLELRPLPDEQWKYKQTLTLNVEEISADKIMARKALITPQTPHQTEWQQIELLNVLINKQYELVFRRTRPHSERPQENSVYLTRVTSLDQESTINAIPKFFDTTRIESEIWATFDRGGELFFARISDSGWKISETRLSADLFPKEVNDK